AFGGLFFLPAELPRGLSLCAVTHCIDPRDALISKGGQTLKALPRGSTVGTSSFRRRALLKRARPDLQVEVMRGNVETRLKKLDDGKCDALLLAAAGLKRLGKEARVTEYLDPFEF